MKRDISLWAFGGFAFTALLGTLLHFIYDWSGNLVLAAPFASVNESTWEHMKLMYFPMLAFAIVQSRYFNDFKNFWWVKLAGIFAGLLLIPMLFYSVRGAFGNTPDFINIAIFFIAAALSFLLEAHLFKNGGLYIKFPLIALLIILIIGILFAVFTFLPPHLPLFRDAVSGSFGIIK